MKIVHLSAYDSGGGAAKSAYRLHEWMVDNGYDSTFVVRKKRVNDSRVIQWGGRQNILSTLRFKFNRKVKFKGQSLYRNLKSVYQSFAFDFRSPDVQPDFNISGDILQIHWIIGFLSFGDIVRISNNFKYVVWRFSDLNPATGGCVINDGCSRYVNGCVSCPISDNSIFRDLVNKNSIEKKLIISSLINKTTLISQSGWMKKLVQESFIFNGFEIEHVANGIVLCAEVVKNISGSNNINALAVSTTFDTARTGFHLLIDICKLNESLSLQIAGGRTAFDLKGIDNLKQLGSLSKKELYDKYESSDVLLFLNKQDNFPNVLLEAGMHSLPVIAFKVDGVTDIIEDGYNGWLFDYGDMEGVSNKFKELSTNKSILMEAGINARKRIEERYDINIQGKRYVDLYRKKLKLTAQS